MFYIIPYIHQNILKVRKYRQIIEALFLIIFFGGLLQFNLGKMNDIQLIVQLSKIICRLFSQGLVQ